MLPNGLLILRRPAGREAASSFFSLLLGYKRLQGLLARPACVLCVHYRYCIAIRGIAILTKNNTGNELQLLWHFM